MKIYTKTGDKGSTGLLGGTRVEKNDPLFLANSAQIDMIFFDANHKKEPTISYFNMCMDKIGKKALFIFDDIYWSKEMKEAWEEICADTRIQVSIDLFSIGIVFIDPELKKKHYTIYY